MLVSERRKRRELDITSKLAKGRIMTGQQLWEVDAGGLRSGGGKVRNCMRVLREMEREGKVFSKRMNVKLFSLDNKFGFWEHQLMLNDFLISRGWFDLCRMEVPIKRDGEIVLRADAGIFLNGEWFMIEVDRTQKKKVNLEKIGKYKELDIKFGVVCYPEREAFWKVHGVDILNKVVMN